MKKQNFKFLVQTRKWGNAKVLNIKAYDYKEAIALYLKRPNSHLTYTVLTAGRLVTESEELFYKSINPITNYQFNLYPHNDANPKN